MSMDDLETLRQQMRTMRTEAEGAFYVGVDALCAEIKRIAASVGPALGEISVNEAWLVIERTVRERCEWLRGERENEP